MRALLTGGIKAILAIAALSTAAHWALRVQRDAPPPVSALAALPDPVTTGSIEPRRVERPSDRSALNAAASVPAAAGLDQTHLATLIAGAAQQQKPKAAKPAGAATKTAAAEKPADKPAAKR